MGHPVLTLSSLNSFDIDSFHGFLAADEPIPKLPKGFEPWEQIAGRLSGLLVCGKLRTTLEKLPALGTDALEAPAQLQRAMLLLSMFGNAYVLGDQPLAKKIPRGVAVPLSDLAEKIGRPPILSHASLILNNWYLVDKDEPLSINNVASRQVFLGGQDERWFYLVTLAVELSGAPAILAIVKAQEAMLAGQNEILGCCLEEFEAAVMEMDLQSSRMWEKCDQGMFYNRIRPFLMGWNSEGIIYEGVSDQPRKYAGATAAQSSLLQALDAGLGIQHNDQFLKQMRRYMPAGHQRFIVTMENAPSMYEYIGKQEGLNRELGSLYNSCIHALAKFRAQHVRMAHGYIARQAATSQSTEGTGGTSFVGFLNKILDNTKAYLFAE